ncbi:MAG: serine hydrolase [Lachnospiraceae bacterium]|nr:serine hydrolase [Lachnospiraceae bacterium]
MTGEETEKGSAKEAVNRRYVKETEKYSEDTGEREEDINTEQTSEYELFTLQDTKMIRDLYPIYLPGVSGPVEYQVLSDNSELVEYLVDVRSSVRNFTLLQKMIENRVAEYDGEWSVYVKNLNTGESIIVNDQPMKSASVMKLFIMGTVYKAIEAGELERTDEVMSLMNNMITVSDNEASNQLLYLLGDSSYEDGIAEVDAFISEYGFSDMTVEYNGFNNSATVTDSNNFNQVSAKDCGKLLEDVYRRNWVNRSVSNEIEEMLLDQHTRYKIPAGLPEGVLCGNKTGEMDNTENDAAIIYSGDCDYILVVLSSDWNSKDETISRIASLSSMVYGFLN